MKRIVAIFLLFTFLFTQTELKQLNKLPFMVQHFLKHNQNGMTLQQFIAHHYFNGDKKYVDNEQDMKLPFKTHSENAQHSILALIPQKSAAVLKKTYVEPRIFLVQEELFSTSSYLSGIWQPPKFS